MNEAWIEAGEKKKKNGLANNIKNTNWLES
jgi:hypothetical protein